MCFWREIRVGSSVRRVDTAVGGIRFRTSTATQDGWQVGVEREEGRGRVPPIHCGAFSSAVNQQIVGLRSAIFLFAFFRHLWTENESVADL